MGRDGLPTATVSALDAAVRGMTGDDPASRWTLTDVIAALRGGVQGLSVAGGAKACGGRRGDTQSNRRRTCAQPRYL